MPILMALILVMIGSAVISGIYAVLHPFVNDLWNIQRYNMAYYGAIAWIERAELVLRWHTAGFEWSGGFINKNTYWPDVDFNSNTIKKEYFWLLAMTGNNNWFFWKITNLTKSIPAPWMWDLDPDVSSGNDYVRLTFNRSLQVALYQDTTEKEWYYTGYKDDNIENINPSNALNINIRVPQKLYKIYAPAWWNALDKDWWIKIDDVKRKFKGIKWICRQDIHMKIIKDLRVIGSWLRGFYMQWLQVLLEFIKKLWEI